MNKIKVDDNIHMILDIILKVSKLIILILLILILLEILGLFNASPDLNSIKIYT